MFSTLIVLSLALFMQTEPLPDFDALWDFGDPAGTEAQFRALLPRAEASGDRSYHAQLLAQIARAQGLQRKFDGAHATLDQVQRMLAEDELGPLPRARCLLERGRVFNSSGHPEEARPLFEEAFELGSRASLDSYAIDAAHMIAIVETDADRQLAWNLRALELAEKSDDARARRWRASLYNNIGWTHFDQQQYEEALEIFERAVALRREQAQPRELRIARYCVAKTLRHLNRIDDALAINRELVDQSGDDGYVFEEMGECLLALGRTEESRPPFRRAYELLSTDAWLAENEPRRLERLKQLGGGGEGS